MANANAALSEQLAVLARIKPQAVTAAATAESDAIDMKLFGKVLFVVNLGDYAAGNDGSIAGGVYGDTESGGSYATLITGKSLTTGTFTGSAGDDAISVIEVDAAEVEAQGLRYLKLKLTPTNQNMTLGAVALGGVSRLNPASDHDIAAVKEIVS